jgi:hypothetical protein
MKMSSISIFAVGSAVIAPVALFLRYLLKQPLKVANTSQEVLDLFEDRFALLEQDATLTSPNDQGRTSERLTVAAPNDLAPVNASSIELSTSTEAYLVYRTDPGHGLHKKKQWESPFPRYFRVGRGKDQRSVASEPSRSTMKGVQHSGTRLI